MILINMPSSCAKKGKYQCKICLQKVNKKDGIQCQGACASWMHYKCLNYTPGKIKDIKLGLLVVACPCPDCDTAVDKEFLADEPFSCNNMKCPANNPPSCNRSDCVTTEFARSMPERGHPPGTLRECQKNQCRNFSAGERRTDPDDPCLNGYTNEPQRECRNSNQPNQRADATQEVMQQMCRTVGELAEQLNFLLDNMQNR